MRVATSAGGDSQTMPPSPRNAQRGLGGNTRTHHQAARVSGVQRGPEGRIKRREGGATAARTRLNSTRASGVLTRPAPQTKGTRRPPTEEA